VSRSISAEFTFFVAIPVMLGASALKFFKYVFVDNIRMTGVQWIVLVVASAVAYAVSMLVIRAVMKFLKKHDFIPFGIYRIVFGVVIILVFALFFH
ncbi:MAG: undecaprenyl-diphosphatase, partial [Lachnospiraceae bacterium]|nr:undecaprenyl-diphosphatase [Lachnospiraceae bacterium]